MKERFLTLLLSASLCVAITDCGGTAKRPPAADGIAGGDGGLVAADAGGDGGGDGGVEGSCVTGLPYAVLSAPAESRSSLPGADYSAQLNKLVLLSTEPKELHLYDPETGTEASIALPTAPISVSVSPDGLYAAVGHDGFVSEVSLSEGTVVTWPVSFAAREIVHGGNGFAYAFPATDGVHSVALATGEVTSGNSFHAVWAERHPNGQIYGATIGVSPADINRYDLDDAGTASEAYDSPYHGDYPIGGNLWLGKDGTSIFTRAGTVFRASDVEAEDMTYRGKLSGGAVRFVYGTANGRIFAIPDPELFSSSRTSLDDAFIEEYDALFNFVAKRRLPCFAAAASDLWAHGRYVFVAPSGTDYYVVVQAVQYECKIDQGCTVEQVTRTPVDQWGVVKLPIAAP